MRFAIRYLTEYRYEGMVTDNLNALRVRPATTPHQRCDEFQARVDPEARVSRHLDYYGTEVLEFGVYQPHERLSIEISTRAATSAASPAPEGPWQALGSQAYASAAGEFALPWHDQPELPGLAGLHDDLRADTPRGTLERLCTLIPERFEYRPGATYVGSDVGDLLEAGAGVCQDFAHLSLVLLRRHGIAARYVSGYLWVAPSDEGTDSLEVDTHAWVEALLPPEAEDQEPIWVGADPTNGGLAGEEHVKIGHGRFYADVLPVKGLYRGPSGSRLEATVAMSRLGAPGAASGSGTP